MVLKDNTGHKRHSRNSQDGYSWIEDIQYVEGVEK